MAYRWNHEWWTLSSILDCWKKTLMFKNLNPIDSKCAYLKLEFLIESLSSDVSSWPSVGFVSVYKINLVLMTLLGKGNTLNGRWIRWYHSLVMFKHPTSPKQRVSFSTGKKKTIFIMFLIRNIFSFLKTMFWKVRSDQILNLVTQRYTTFITLFYYYVPCFPANTHPIRWGVPLNVH